MYDKNFELRMRVSSEFWKQPSSKGLDARMPCPRKDRAMVIKGATVMEDKGVPPKKGLTTK